MKLKLLLARWFASPIRERTRLERRAFRQFLTAHHLPEEQVYTAWEAIARQTTPDVTQYMRPGLEPEESRSKAYHRARSRERRDIRLRLIAAPRQHEASSVV